MDENTIHRFQRKVQSAPEVENGQSAKTGAVHERSVEVGPRGECGVNGVRASRRTAAQPGPIEPLAACCPGGGVCTACVEALIGGILGATLKSLGRFSSSH